MLLFDFYRKVLKLVGMFTKLLCIGFVVMIFLGLFFLPWLDSQFVSEILPQLAVISFTVGSLLLVFATGVEQIEALFSENPVEIKKKLVLNSFGFILSGSLLIISLFIYKLNLLNDTEGIIGSIGSSISVLIVSLSALLFGLSLTTLIELLSKFSASIE